MSSAESEVRRLLVRARQLAEQLGLPVSCWMSDQPDAFVTGSAAEFPGVPHRYCQNHFLRDLAKPVLERDSHAKVRMRSKVRGLRAIEREMLPASPPPPPEAREATTAPGEAPLADPQTAKTSAAGVVLDYCAAVRGLLNDDQGARCTRPASAWPTP